VVHTVDGGTVWMPATEAEVAATTVTAAMEAEQKVFEQGGVVHQDARQRDIQVRASDA
jgi:hypothetical protein